MDKKRFHSVDEYISNFSGDINFRLKKIKKIINEIAPEAAEIISYNMPAYKIYGRILLYFAVHSKHIGLYAMPSAIIKYKKELSGYVTSKGTIQFPFDKPMPYDLIRKIVSFRVKENLNRLKN
jgi:uncharacterized protein YdhG (YjbR/CyaY superfamily)